MPFTLFSDFHAVIRSNSRLFSLETFTQDYFDILDLGFEVYKNSKYKKTGLDMKNMGFRECFEAIRGFHRRQNDVKFLLQPESWEQFSEHTSENLILQKQLEETQENFRKQNRFATHSNESLLEAYEQLLKLEELLIFALKDLKKSKNRLYFSKMSKTLNKKYEIYLTSQLAIIKQEKEDIAANMLNRLFLCSQDPALENTDTLPEVIRQLKTKGFLKPSYTAPKISNDKLTKKLFYQFHEIILNSNHSEAIFVLQGLPWFKKQRNLAERFEVADWMPRKARKPKFLFFNANLRYHWFKNYYTQAQIDSSLNYLHSQKVRGDLTFNSLSYRIVVISTAEASIKSELARINQAKQDCQRGLRKLFRKKTMFFLNKIESQIYDQYLLLISEKVILMEFLAVTPEEHLENIDLGKFMLDLQKDLVNLEKYFTKPKVLSLWQKYNNCSKKLKKLLTLRYEKQLKDYLYQWTQLAHKPVMDQDELTKLHQSAQEQEALFKSVLTEDWVDKIEAMQNLRTQNKFMGLEKAAQENLIYLLGVNPVLLRESIRKELNILKESLINYIKTQVYDFDYEDQKGALARMMGILSQENITEAENSESLTDSQKGFLEAFPEINFYINSMLKLKEIFQIILKLYNPDDIEGQLNNIYRFIKRQEAKFLAKNQVKFIDLFPRSKSIEENRDLINQLRKGIV